MNPSDLPAYDQIMSRATLPVTLYPFQRDSVNALSALPCSALYHEPGAGKTLTVLAMAIYKMLYQGVKHTLVLMPPILITNWKKVVESTQIDGKTPTVCAYRGSPAQRKAMKVADYQFILMSYDIFKRDHDRLLRELGYKRLFVVADEANALCNVATQNYRKFREFTMEQMLCLMTGTPMASSPAQAYGLIKLVTPTAYKTLYQFNNIHVAETDFFDNPVKWRNLDLLETNLMNNADRKLLAEVVDQLPPCIVNTIEYDLHPKHYRLYKKLAEEEMLLYKDGTMLDATSVQALFHNLQQIVVNGERFSDGDAFPITPLELVQEVLDEIAPAKLVVCAHYKMTHHLLAEKFKHVGAVGIWGETSAKAKDAAIERFVTDPNCRLMHINPRAAGVGVDHLQTVCHNMLFIEIPITPLLFEQARGRLYRNGQKSPVNVRLAVANGTLQARAAKNVAEKQALLNSVQRGLTDLKAAIFGN